LNPQGAKHRRILSTQAGSEPFGKFSTLFALSIGYKASVLIGYDHECWFLSNFQCAPKVSRCRTAEIDGLGCGPIDEITESYGVSWCLQFFLAAREPALKVFKDRPLATVGLAVVARLSTIAHPSQPSWELIVDVIRIW